MFSVLMSEQSATIVKLFSYGTLQLVISLEYQLNLPRAHEYYSSVFRDIPRREKKQEIILNRYKISVTESIVQNKFVMCLECDFKGIFQN